MDHDAPVLVRSASVRISVAPIFDGLGVNDRSGDASDVWSGSPWFRWDAIAVGKICKRYAGAGDGNKRG